MELAIVIGKEAFRVKVGYSVSFLCIIFESLLLIGVMIIALYCFVIVGNRSYGLCGRFHSCTRRECKGLAAGAQRKAVAPREGVQAYQYHIDILSAEALPLKINYLSTVLEF